MSEAVTVPNLKMMTLNLIVSEESLTRDRHTDLVSVIFLSYNNLKTKAIQKKPIS